MALKGRDQRTRLKSPVYGLIGFNREFTGNTCLDWRKTVKSPSFPSKTTIFHPHSETDLHAPKGLYGWPGGRKKPDTSSPWCWRELREVTSGASCCRGRSNESSVTRWKPLNTFQGPPRRRGREVKGWNHSLRN